LLPGNFLTHDLPLGSPSARRAWTKIVAAAIELAIASTGRIRRKVVIFESLIAFGSASIRQ
jgi:hypothetical protein